MVRAADVLLQTSFPATPRSWTPHFPCSLPLACCAVVWIRWSSLTECPLNARLETGVDLSFISGSTVAARAVRQCFSVWAAGARVEQWVADQAPLASGGEERPLASLGAWAAPPTLRLNPVAQGPGEPRKPGSPGGSNPTAVGYLFEELRPRDDVQGGPKPAWPQ